MLFDHGGPGADYESVYVVQDRPSGLKALICLHSTALGPAAGGIRRMAYADEPSALTDAAKLAHGMSLKNAMAGLPAGGAKAVILDHPRLDRPAAYRALGRAIEALGGAYRSGPDVGTTTEDLEEVRKMTRHVNAASNDAGVATARGVLAGLHGTAFHLDGDRSLSGRHFSVQGLGGVGGEVARLLLAEGATVIGADPRQAACNQARAAGATIVAPDKILAEQADVFVPCALGGILDDYAVKRLAARAICGSANNQLSTLAVGEALHAAGIVYAPDFLVNAGAVIEGVLTFDAGATAQVRTEAATRIGAIEQTLSDVLAKSRVHDKPPEQIAIAEGERLLASARDARAT